MVEERVQLSKRTTRLRLHCEACSHAREVQRVGAVHSTRWGNVLEVVEYPDEAERDHYATELGHTGPLPPEVQVVPLDGSELAPSNEALRTACPNHGALLVDLEAVDDALRRRWRVLLLPPSAH
jgi:hypothetical protein